MQRTAARAGALAALLGQSPSFVSRLRRAAALHDIGKATVRLSILEKPGPLTAPERAEMECHTLVGHRILVSARGLDPLAAARIALTHHERFDGHGYPFGLAGEQIPIEARIVAVADVLDALLSDRPYRPAVSPPEAFEALAAGRGSHFDPAVIDAALENPEALLAAATAA